MLGDFITRCLVLLLGYAYPAFGCFKSVEKNKVDIQELRFWCQYWIIVAMLTVLERFTDIFISWLPMYGEAKLAFLIYLWYPKTKGTAHVYDILLRPLVSRHETDIDRKLLEFRARVWDLAIFYWQNCTTMGQTTFFQCLQFLAAQSAKMNNNSNQKTDRQDPGSPHPPPPPSFHHRAPNRQANQSGKNKKWLPTPPYTPSSTVNRSISGTPESNLVQVEPRSQTETVHIEDASETEQSARYETRINDKLHEARLRLRRAKPTH